MATTVAEAALLASIAIIIRQLASASVALVVARVVLIASWLMVAKDPVQEPLDVVFNCPDQHNCKIIKIVLVLSPTCMPSHPLWQCVFLLYRHSHCDWKWKGHLVTGAIWTHFVPHMYNQYFLPKPCSQVRIANFEYVQSHQFFADVHHSLFLPQSRARGAALQNFPAQKKMSFGSMYTRNAEPNKAVTSHFYPGLKMAKTIQHPHVLHRPLWYCYCH